MSNSKLPSQQSALWCWLELGDMLVHPNTAREVLTYFPVSVQVNLCLGSYDQFEGKLSSSWADLIMIEEKLY